MPLIETLWNTLPPGLVSVILLLLALGALSMPSLPTLLDRILSRRADRDRYAIEREAHILRLVQGSSGTPFAVTRADLVRQYDAVIIQSLFDRGFLVVAKDGTVTVSDAGQDCLAAVDALLQTIQPSK